MRFERNIYLTGTGTFLPPVVPVRPAVEAGLIGETHRDLGYDSVAVAEDISAVDMAVEAARVAVRRAGLPPEEYGLALHASLWFQGLDMWASASYVANRSVGTGALAFDVQQRSNGGMGALHLAATYLSTGAATAALVTTGDRFAAPAFDRWGSEFYSLFGDGGTAIALSTRTGFARILASAVAADNGLEPWGRGSTPFGTAPGQVAPVPVLLRAAQHAATPEAEGSWERIEARMLQVRDEVLADAGVGVEDVARVAQPFIHRGGGQGENYDLLGFGEKKSTWELGREVGHLGAGDQAAGLNHLLERRLVGPGDLVLMVGVGVGFSFTATLLEVTDPPRW
ncbi:ketoacyl-ACP synthase III family protein [Micromonospora siamensis]|uniref:3-oxoacyl-[acyl-carrier-protein] synthase-3 n=1 Tax=Micromonospora siamensis TaxID=299152 RepID=A0A1C5HUI2_9ACTN|nr:ketoacyl-ACP synthase III family protein [Micromonospora siamensis]SCG49695.1 3-oxoacyl-[acyl-carrier-protein] synthase-3 [Micromonospora siamensis]